MTMTSWAQLDPAIQAHIRSTLTDKQLRVFQERLNGHSWRAIAKAHGTNEASTRGLHNRALDRLERARKEAA